MTERFTREEVNKIVQYASMNVYSYYHSEMSLSEQLLVAKIAKMIKKAVDNELKELEEVKEDD